MDVETNPGPNTAESTVSEMEFQKLARDIPPSSYEAVGRSLGFSDARLQAILVENPKNYTNALLDVFMKWNVMQQRPHSNKRQLLADKLQEIDLGGLSDRLLNGSLIPISTDMELSERSVLQPFVGKRVICTPYVLPPVKKVLYLSLLLCIHDDGTDHNQKRKEEMKEYIRLFPPQQMLVEWTYGDIVIKLFDGRNGNEKEICEKKLSEKDTYLRNWKCLSFEVKPLESGASQKFLKFTLNQTKSPCDPTVIEFNVPYDDTKTAAAGVSMPSKTDLDSDGILDEIAKRMPHETYTTLCRELDIEYNEANNILTRFSMDNQRATRHCLAQWKTRTGGNMAELKTILVAAGVRSLVKYVK